MSAAPHDAIDWDAYVEAMSAVHGVALDASRRAAVVAQLQRVESLARHFLDHPLPDDVEPAEVFSP